MITMTKRKPMPAVQTPASEPLSDQVDTLRRRQKTLQLRERDLLSNAHDVPKGAGPLNHVQLGKLARKLLSGDGFEPDEDAPLLVQIQQELQVTQYAADELDKKLYVQKFRSVHDAFHKDGREWRELVRATALLIAELQGLNAKRMAMAQKIKQGTSLSLPAEYPASGGRLLGFGNAQVAGDGGAYEYLRQVITAGICTQNEIEQARANAAK